MDAIKNLQKTVQHIQERGEVQKGKKIKVHLAIIIILIDIINIK